MQQLSDFEQFIDLIITENQTLIQIPELSTHNSKQKTIQVVKARWEWYGQDSPDNFTGSNYVLEYQLPNKVNPIYLRSNDPPDPWDTYHDYYIFSIILYGDFAKTWNAKGVSTNQLCQLFKDDLADARLQSGIWQYLPNGDGDVFYIGSQQQVTIRTGMIIGNRGSIVDPSDPQQIKWKELKEELLFRDQTKNIIQPQPNFNRPLYLRLKISYF